MHAFGIATGIAAKPAALGPPEAYAVAAWRLFGWKDELRWMMPRGGGATANRKTLVPRNCLALKDNRNVGLSLPLAFRIE
jgi:hypothetical protein